MCLRATDDGAVNGRGKGEERRQGPSLRAGDGAAGETKFVRGRLWVGWECRRPRAGLSPRPQGPAEDGK